MSGIEVSPSLCELDDELNGELLLWFDELNGEVLMLRDEFNVYMLHVFLLEVVVLMNNCMKYVARSNFGMLFIGCSFLSRQVCATAPHFLYASVAAPLLLLDWPIFLPVGPFQP